jgi:formate dehydrogenase subunit gamma
MGQEEDAEGVIAIVRRHMHLEADYGWIAESTIRIVAKELNLSRAEVHGVISFYHDFRTAPEPRPVVKLCRAEACQARGSEPLANWAIETAGERLAIEPVYCLGLCSVGPNAIIGSDVHARLDEQRLGALIGAL